MQSQKEDLVDAIEEGKIVQVSESYARQEGLLILRKPQIKDLNTRPAVQEIKKERQEFSRFETLRKPLPTRQNNVLSSLVQNFHWIILAQRKQRNITRKQLALALNESEYNIKLVENGVLPADDYVLISKIERYFNTSLRKDALSAPPVHKARQELKKQSTQQPPPVPAKQEKQAQSESEDLLGNTIELIDDS